tara:strand:+ start:2710 stop:3498 length:789 start_codon:yes stop_codon:yes gene_type:complete
MKYNKKRNTAFLYEALVLEMTKAIVNHDDTRRDIALDILKENFNSDSILHEELDAYKAVLETKGVEKSWAEMVLREAQRTYLSLHPDHVFQQQSHVINRVNKELGKDTFNIFTPNYKSLATIAQLFSVRTPVKRRVILENNLIQAMTSENKAMNVEPIDNVVYNVFVKKFNEKYETLLEEQKDLLYKYIFSFADDGYGLKISINEEIARLKQIVAEGKKDMPDLKERFETLENLLGSFSKKDVDDNMVLKIMQTQEFCKELR